MSEYQDSTGKEIYVGDTVRHRGAQYIIKAFKPGIAPAKIEFVNTDVVGDEFSVDLIKNRNKPTPALATKDDVTWKLEQIYEYEQNVKIESFFDRGWEFSINLGIDSIAKSEDFYSFTCGVDWLYLQMKEQIIREEANNT